MPRDTAEEEKQRETEENGAVAAGTGAAAEHVMAELFEWIEASRAELGLQEYALSPTTLEQIFNRFAREQARASTRVLVEVGRLAGTYVERQDQDESIL